MRADAPRPARKTCCGPRQCFRDGCERPCRSKADPLLYQRHQVFRAVGPRRRHEGAVITQTADGFYDPASGDFGETVLKLAPKAVRLLDSFTPANWQFLNTQDLDLG